MADPGVVSKFLKKQGVPHRRESGHRRGVRDGHVH